jgi:hypothetical protein
MVNMKMNKVFLIVGIFLILTSIKNVNAESYIQNNDIVNCIGKQCSMQIRSDKVYWSINHIQEDKNIDVKILDIINNDTVIFSVTNKEITTVPFSVKTNVIGSYAEQSTLKTGINEITYKSSVDLNKLTFKFGNNSTLITLNYTKSSDDAYVYEGAVNTNYGTATTLYIIGALTAVKSYSFIKFNISSIPTNKNISSANLCIYSSYVGTNGLINVYNVYNNTWDELTTTWNDNPCGTGITWNTNKCNTTYANQSTMILNNYACFNVTVPAIKAYFNGSNNLSVALGWSTTTSGNSVYFTSKEGTASQTPYLNITYEDIVVIQNGNVTFNVRDNATNLHINNLTISCNNSFTNNSNSPIVHEFQYADYNCSFANSSYYSNVSIFTVNSATKEINLTMALIPSGAICNITFDVTDSITGNNITNIGLNCNVSYWNKLNSSFKLEFNQSNYNCKFNSSGYNDVNKSFTCSGSDISVSVSMIKIVSGGGLTVEEHNWLKTTYFLQAVQGLDIYPTNNTCISDSVLLHEYIAEMCLDSDCSNLTIRQSSVYCPFGCITDINSFNAVCKEPDYLIWIILIIIAVIVIYIAVKVLA